MASYSTNEFRSGLKIMLDGDPCAIIDNEFVKPGKGQAFNRVKFRNLLTGRVNERTFKSGDSVEAADVLDVELQYLYSDGEEWHFMHADSFEQQFINQSGGRSVAETLDVAWQLLAELPDRELKRISEATLAAHRASG